MCENDRGKRTDHGQESNRIGKGEDAVRNIGDIQTNQAGKYKWYISALYSPSQVIVWKIEK